MFAQSRIDLVNNYKLLFSRDRAVPQQMRAVLGKVIITDQNKCRYVYTAKIFSLAYLHAFHMPHVFCDSP